MSDRDVEVTTQDKVGAAAKQGNTIENVVHRADISAFTDRSVNAEHYQRTFRPRHVPDFTTDHPTVVIRNHDRDQRCASCKKSASPTSRFGRPPRESIVVVMPESLTTRRTLRGTTFLRHHQIGF